MSVVAEKIFEANRDGLAQCQAFLESLCDNPKPQIILDEIVSNIVRCSGAKSFSVTYAEQESGETVMTFTDDGAPFDPTTEAPAPDIAAPTTDRQIGGLGIFMVKKMSKKIEYRRADAKNVLQVTL